MRTLQQLLLSFAVSLSPIFVLMPAVSQAADPSTVSASGFAKESVDEASVARDAGIEAMVPSADAGRAKSLANGLFMSGPWNAVWSGSSVSGTLDRINNESFTRTSGTLRLELWAVASPPGRGAAFTGYRLAVFPTLDPLPPRTFYSALVGSATMAYPPDGTWWLNLVLTEYDSTNCSLADRYCMQDSSISTTSYVFGVPPPPPPVANFGNFTDLWWNANESGWGASITHHSSGVAFIAWYTYDSVGNPKWYVASNCRIVNNFCSDTLYETSGPAFGPTFNPAFVQVRSVGTISLSFSSINNGTLSYNVRGSTGSRSITRQGF